MTETGPDPLSPAQRISVLRGHLEREKSARRDAEAELARLRDAARMLGKVVTGHSRAMEAARIELAQGSAGKAMEWILNSLPDVWDDPETEWDGFESADEWWDRTENFYRDAEAASPVAAGPEGRSEPLVMPDGLIAMLKAAARTFGMVATKPCGCGPDEPCDAHAEPWEAEPSPASPEPDTASTGPAERSAGVALIRAERARQVAVEGYTAGHDAEHGNGELAEAAVAYALAANGDGAYREFWPFRLASFKASDPAGCLVKAGALIAAELDRILAITGSEEKSHG